VSTECSLFLDSWDQKRDRQTARRRAAPGCPWADKGSRRAHRLAPEPDPPRTASAPSSSSSLAPATAASGWPARQRTYVRLPAHGASATRLAVPARVLQSYVEQQFRRRNDVEWKQARAGSRSAHRAAR